MPSSARSWAEVFPSADGWRLLEALEAATMKYGRADPPARVAEEIADDAGIAKVGQPDTRMALAMREFAQLAEVGLVARVKGADPDERMAYRLTMRGARALWEREAAEVVRGFERKAAHMEAELGKAVEQRDWAEGELAELEEWASSWRRRTFTRMPR